MQASTRIIQMGAPLLALDLYTQHMGTSARLHTHVCTYIRRHGICRISYVYMFSYSHVFSWTCLVMCMHALDGAHICGDLALQEPLVVIDQKTVASTFVTGAVGSVMALRTTPCSPLPVSTPGLQELCAGELPSFTPALQGPLHFPDCGNRKGF